MYHNNRPPAKPASLQKLKNQRSSANLNFHLLKNILKATINFAFSTLKHHHIVSKSSRENDLTQMLGAQFISHCATIIQKHFRGYMQQKRYRQFLPIYRRFRELLTAGTQGWRIRRIMKLPTIKSLIKSIKEKIGKGHVNMARINKREFIDEIERLRRRGQWLDLQPKLSRTVGKTRQPFNKQNVSLYGNIKPKSIKNIFEAKKQLPAKPNKETKQKKTNQAKLNHQANHQQYQQVSQSPCQKNRRNPQIKLDSSYDEIPIKGTQDFYKLLQQQCQMPMQLAIPKKKSGISGKDNKKRGTGLTKDEESESMNSTEVNLQSERIDNSKVSQIEKESIIDRYEFHEVETQSLSYQHNSKKLEESASRPKTKHSRKLKLTLTRKATEESDIRNENSRKASKITDCKLSIVDVKEQTLPQMLQQVKSNKRPSCISHLLKVYQEVYLAKRGSLAVKIKQLEGKQAKAQVYEGWD